MTTTIRPISPPQFALAGSWLSRPDVNRWLFSEWRGRQCDERVVAIMAANKKNHAWCAISEGIAVGLVVLSEIDRRDRTANIWYVRGEPEPRGAMTKAVREVTTVAFTELGLSTLIASVMEPNSASRALLERVGFRLVGRIRGGFRLEDEPVDRLVYDLTSHDVI